MKRFLCSFLAFIFVIGVFFSTPVIASAEGDVATPEVVDPYEGVTGTEFSTKGLIKSGSWIYYRESEDATTVRIKEFVGTEGSSVSISEGTITVGETTYNITGIEANAFDTCAQLTQLTIPTFITSINKNAFVGSSLTSITYQGHLGAWESAFTGDLGKIALSTAVCEGAEISYVGSGNIITATCGACQEKCGIFKLDEGDYIYNGQPQGKPVKEIGNIPLTEMPEVEYWGEDDVDSTTTPPTDAGKYTAKLILVEADEGGNGEVSATVNFEIKYLEVSEDAYTISEPVCENGNLKWYKDSVTVYPANNYNKISASLTGDYDDSITISDSEQKFYLKNEAGQMTDAIALPEDIRFDNIAPTVTFKTGGTELTEEIYSATEVTVSITITDEESGVATGANNFDAPKYYVGESTTDKNSITNWQSLGKEPITVGIGGSKKVFVKVSDNVGNETIASSPAIIEPATLIESDFTFTPPTELTYDGDPKVAKVESEKVATENILIKYYDGETLLDNAPTNVGTYRVKIDVNNESQYKNIANLTCGDWTFEIAKADVTLELPTAVADLVYTGESLNLINAGSTDDGTIYYTLNPADDSSWKEDEVPTGIDAKAYKVYYKVIGDANHNDIAHSESNCVEVTIAPMTITPELVLPENGYSYNNQEHKPTVKFRDSELNEVTKIVEGENTDYTVSYTDNVNAGTDTAIATIKLKENGNYTFGLDNGNQVYSKTLKYPINKATPAAGDFTFSAPDNLECDDSAKNVTVTAKGDIIGMGVITNVKYYDASGALLTETPKSEGTYTVKIDVAEGTNYIAVNDIDDPSWTFTITPHIHTWTYLSEGTVNAITAKCVGCPSGDTSVTISLICPTSEELVYNGQPKTVPVVVSDKTANVTRPDKVVYTFNDAEVTECINAGTYKATITIGEAKASINFTITEKDLSDVAIIDNIASVTYTGSEIKPKLVIKDGNTPLVENTDYTVSYSGNINVGEATANVTFIGNYKGNAIKTFNIEKAQVVITAPTVKTLTYTGSAQTLLDTNGSATFGEIEYSLDNQNWSKTIPTAIKAAEYTVYYRVVDSDNYIGATGSVKVIIANHVHDWEFEASGAVITATCQNTVGCDIKDTIIKLEVNEPTSNYLVYNGEVKEVTYTITKGYEDVFGDVDVEYTKEERVNVGDYKAIITAKGNTIVYNFSITPRTIVIASIEGLKRVYDGTTKVDLSTATKVVYTIDGLDYKPLEFDFSKVEATADDADVGDGIGVKLEGKVTVIGDDKGNYICSLPKTTTMEITPATLTITPDAKSSEQYYDLPALTYKVTGLIGEDKLTKAPTLTTNANIKTVGNYTITATGAEASANYTITYAATATLTVTEHKNHKVATDGWKVTVPGTCMVVGKEAGTCTLCSGTVTRDSKIDPNNHTLITTVVKLQTCTQKGEALVTCDNGCSYSLKTALPADGKSHPFAEEFTVNNPTCTEKGSKYKVCESLGCTAKSEYAEIPVNPDAHVKTEIINTKVENCTEEGYTGDTYCPDCEKVVKPGVEIPAKGHTESDWIIDKPASFTEEGAKHKECTVCKTELKKEVIAKLALDTPTVKIENNGSGIKVSWSQDEDATGYTVYRSEYNPTTKKWSKWKSRGTAAATKKSWVDKTVKEGVTYRFTVRGVNGENKSAYKATEGLLYVVAPKVTVSISSTGLLAKWNKVNNATGYIVYRAALGADGKWGSWVKLGTTKPEKNTWYDDKATSGTTYRYTARAVVNKVNSGYTASSSVIYLAQPLLKISNTSTGIIGKWDPIAGATGYTIYRSEYNASTKKWSKWLTLGTTKDTAKSFTDKTVKSGYTYKYTIRAINGKFKSTYQDSNKLIYLAQPTLTASIVANGIQGKWNQVSGATGYIIYRRELKDGKWTGWTSLGTAKSTAKSFTDKTVKSGVTYSYTIRAKNGSNKSSYVSTSSLVFLSVPTVKISSATTGVNVSWSKITGATSYLVYRREVVNGKWSGWSQLKTVAETSFVDTTAKSNTQYRYTVRALNGKSKSAYTSTSTLLYLAAPTVTLEKATDGIKVNWTQSAGATGYIVYRAELGADGKWSKWVALGNPTASHSSCKDKTVKADVTYKYTVRAVNGKVKSAYIDNVQIANKAQ